MNQKQKLSYITTLFSIFGNLLLAIIKVSSILILIGLKYSGKPADKNHPYGHGKIEPLITFIIVGILVSSAVFIAYQSYQNIHTPHKNPKGWTLIPLGIIILWKEISYRIVIKNSKITGSSSLKADAWHHRSDAITSVAAFIGISISLLLGKGFEAADDWAALLASLVILYNAYQIFRPALGEILDEDMYEDLSYLLESKIYLKMLKEY